MQNLFHTLSERFKLVAGVAARSLPSPRLGIVATSPRGCVLAGRVGSELARGRRTIASLGRPAVELDVDGELARRLASSRTRGKRYSAVAATRAGRRSANRGLVARLERSDGIQATTGMRRGAVADRTARRGECEPGPSSAQLAAGRTGTKMRIVWLLDAATPVAPLLRGWDFKKPDVKVPVESTGGALTRQERQRT